MNLLNRLALAVPFFLFFAQAVNAQHKPSSPADVSNLTNVADSDGLQKVALVHGQAGPFAIAGYRMDQRALKELNAKSGEF